MRKDKTKSEENGRKSKVTNEKRNQRRNDQKKIEDKQIERLKVRRSTRKFHMGTFHVMKIKNLQKINSRCD